MAIELNADFSLYWVVEHDDVIVGYAGLRSLEGAADSDVQTIALDESVRGRGEGRALLRTLLSAAVARRARETFLDVRADNVPAIALYRSEGFVEIGRRPGYYAVDGTDAIVMRLDLRKWVAAQHPDAGGPSGATTVVPVSSEGANDE